MGRPIQGVGIVGKRFDVDEHLGSKYNYFTLVGKTDKRVSNGGGQIVRCECICGTVKDVILANILNGSTKSCGCMKFAKPRWKDETGNRYGKITVLSKADYDKKGTFWNVKCDCGNEWIINRKKLWKGQVSCAECSHKRAGTKNKNYIVGNYYGYLKVVSDEGYADPVKGYCHRYKCVCDCGKLVTVAGTLLTSGKTKSCGCMKGDIAWAASHKNDLCKIGARLGTFTILKEDDNIPNKFHCRCICGQVRVFQREDINSGKIPLCSKCESRKARSSSIAGRKFGRLTALKMIPKGEKAYRSWLCECECGTTSIILESNLIGGNSGQCAICRDRLNGEKQIKDLVGERFGMLTVFEISKKNKSGNYQWLCKCDCGETTVVSSSNLLQGHTLSCGCSMSTGEVLLAKALRKNKIKFVKQKKFDGCVDKGVLRFDFYLPNYGWCIECNGHQHYRPVEWFGGEEQFATQKRRDKIKSDFCKDNFIPLIRIHYSDYKEMDRVADSITACLKRLPSKNNNINVR